MEQEIIEELQHLCLTKEETEDILISAQSRDDLLEECSLSLFGRLLSDRQQNLRALKNTLKATWKMGSELRIVDVGNNTLQFKFGSSYQRDWVENSGPWNFENNLLLLCRWKKGLTAANIVFTHSPFWVQLWGLPFELMSEEVGQDIGRSLGRLIEVDKRASQSDQAKFLRIRVDLPIEKPLRRGGHIVNKSGEKFWINFRYERLPTFCYLCGLLGHDDKHCRIHADWQNTPKQYGEWLKANGAFNGGSAKQMNFSSKNFSARKDVNGSEGQTAAENFLHVTPAGCREGNVNGGYFQNSKIVDKSVQNQSCSVSDTQVRQAAKVRSEGDIKENEMWDTSQKAEASTESPIPTQLNASDLVTRFGERSTSQSSCLSAMIVESNAEVTSPQKPRYWAQMQEAKADQAAAQEVIKHQKGKGRIKRIAREKGQAQRKEKQAIGPISGTKRQIALLFTEGKIENLDNSTRKRKCEGLNHVDHGVHGSIIADVAHDVHDSITLGVNNGNDNCVQNDVALGVQSVAHGIHDEFDISAVAAEQHRRKP